MLQYDGEPASQSKLAAPKTDKKDLTGINKEANRTIQRQPAFVNSAAPKVRDALQSGCPVSYQKELFTVEGVVWLSVGHKGRYCLPSIKKVVKNNSRKNHCDHH
jgi:hypothetical protein